jgi:hypothetical protein
MADEHLPAPWCPRNEIIIRDDTAGWISGSSGSDRPHTVAALARAYPAWAITFEPLLAVYTAERRDGTSVHVLAAHRPSDLAAKIEAAEDDDIALCPLAKVPCEPNAFDMCKTCGRDLSGGSDV